NKLQPKWSPRRMPMVASAGCSRPARLRTTPMQPWAFAGDSIWAAIYLCVSSTCRATAGPQGQRREIDTLMKRTNKFQPKWSPRRMPMDSIWAAIYLCASSTCRFPFFELEGRLGQVGLPEHVAADVEGDAGPTADYLQRVTGAGGGEAGE